jgi:hypothetical protein
MLHGPLDGSPETQPVIEKGVFQRRDGGRRGTRPGSARRFEWLGIDPRESNGVPCAIYRLGRVFEERVEELRHGDELVS